MPGKPLNEMTDRDLIAALIAQGLLTGKSGTGDRLQGEMELAVDLADRLLAALNRE
jgi:hypothetical protein